MLWFSKAPSLKVRSTKERSIRSVVSTNAVRYKWHHFVRNEEVRRLTGQPKLTPIVQSRRLTVSGHIARMDDNAGAKSILSTFPTEDCRRPRGRLRITWLSTIQAGSYNLTLPEAMDMAQNQSLWRM